MKCLNCEKETTNPKFCGRSCAASYNNRKHPKRSKTAWEWTTCENCGVEYEYNTSNRTGKYCSTACFGEHKYKTVSVPQILEGTCTNVPALKRYLSETAGDECNICGQGLTWKGKPLTLQLDHIDGNSDNNDLDNLRLLCPNCHSQTETFSGRSSKKDTKRNRYLREWKGYTGPAGVTV